MDVTRRQVVIGGVATALDPLSIARAARLAANNPVGKAFYIMLEIAITHEDADGAIIRNIEGHLSEMNKQSTSGKAIRIDPLENYIRQLLIQQKVSINNFVSAVEKDAKTTNTNGFLSLFEEISKNEGIGSAEMQLKAASLISRLFNAFHIEDDHFYWWKDVALLRDIKDFTPDNIKNVIGTHAYSILEVIDLKTRNINCPEPVLAKIRTLIGRIHDEFPWVETSNSSPLVKDALEEQKAARLQKPERETKPSEKPISHAEINRYLARHPGYPERNLLNKTKNPPGVNALKLQERKDRDKDVPPERG